MMAAATVEDGGLCCDGNTGVVRLQCTIRIKIGHVHSNNHHYYHDDDDSHHQCCGHLDDSLSLRKDHHGVGCCVFNQREKFALRPTGTHLTFDTFAMFQLILSYSVDDVIF